MLSLSGINVALMGRDTSLTEMFFRAVRGAIRARGESALTRLLVRGRYERARVTRDVSRFLLSALLFYSPAGLSCPQLTACCSTRPVFGFARVVAVLATRGSNISK